MSAVGIVGGGAWGTALALMLDRAGHSVRVLTRNSDTVAQGVHPLFPSIPLPPTMVWSSSPAVLAGAEAVFSVVPVQVTADVLAGLALKPDQPVILCSKGLVRPEGCLLTDAVQKCCPNPLAVLSGPSFAHEVAAGCPTMAVLACDALARGHALEALFRDPSFQVIVSDDRAGVQLAGALKNVLAFVAGFLAGGPKGGCENLRAAFLALAMGELARLMVATGGRPETLFGLAGLGDSVLTATSARSRNFAAGVHQARNPDAPFNDLAEGVFTASVLEKMMARAGLTLPVLSASARLVQGAVPLDQGMEILQQSMYHAASSASVPVAQQDRAQDS